MRTKRAAWIAGTAGLVCVQAAHATWSIVIANTRTKEVAVGCATCLEGFDLAQGTPVMLVGRGAASAQSSVDVGGYNRTIIRDRLLGSDTTSQILTFVRAGDTNANNRQYGIARAAFGSSAATYTGPLAAQWAGGVTGQFTDADGDYVYAIQGNILTGANVVNDARDALASTPGSLPERLMAAMEAARVAGGDGRCSCTTGGPTSCGSPPPVPFKSAHVGYMMAARAGDLDGGLATYRAGTAPLGVATGDLNLDGSPDVVAANNGSNNASVYRNPRVAPSRFMQLNTPTSTAFAGSPRGIVLQDVNSDNRPDAFVTAFSANQILVRPAISTGAFGALEQAATGSGPIHLVLADLAGSPTPEIVTANFLGGSLSVIPITSAQPTGITMGAAATISTGGQPIAVAAGDLDGDTDTDVVAADFAGARLVQLLNTGGTLASGADIPVAAGAADVATADLDGDGDTDLAAVCQTDRSVFIVTRSAGGWTPVRAALPFAPGKVRVGDLNSDGDPDLAILGGNAFATYLSQNGVLTTLTVYPGPPDVQSHQWSALDLADMDRDGDLDMVVTQAVSPGGVALIENMGGSAGQAVGTFRAGVGQAIGDYYLNLNVASTQAGDPDPVVSLRQQFDVWRASLIGVPDAIRSGVTVSRERISAGCPGVMTISLRDWQGALVTAPYSLNVVHAGGSAGTLTLGGITQVSPGVYEVALSVQGQPSMGGLNTFRVTASGAGLTRPVILTPDAGVNALRGPLDDIDFNNDGLFPDTADIMSLFCVFAGGNCGCDSTLGCDSLDFNQDGLFPDTLDIEEFLDVFAGHTEC